MMMGRRIFSLLVVLLFVYVASPLILPVVMGAVFAVLFYPWLEALERRKIATPLASGLLTLSVTLVFLIPAAFLIFVGAKAGFQQLRAWKDAPRIPGDSFVENLVSMPGVQDLLERMSTWFPIGIHELISTVEDLSRTIGVRLADLLGNFFGQLPGMTVGMAIMVVSIYFFLVDGRKVVHFLRRNSFFSPDQTEELFRSFAGMCRSVILATLVSGFVQSVVFSLSCLATGVGNVGVIGLLVFLASFIPLVGSAPVTIGVALHQALNGNTTAGIVLLVMAGIVSLIDNLIRPLVLQGSANLHPLLAFIAAFGGLQVFGFSGVFLGPIVAGLFMATIQGLFQPEEAARRP